MGQTGKASSNPIKETRADALSISAIRARTHHATRTNDGWEAMLAQACSRSALPFFAWASAQRRKVAEAYRGEVRSIKTGSRRSRFSVRSDKGVRQNV